MLQSIAARSFLPAEHPAMQADSKQKIAIQWIGFFLGPILASVCLWLLPSQFESAQSVSTEFSWAGRATLAVMVWMGVWWLTEAIDISATALLPLVLFPLLGATNIKDAAAPYADHLIFLYFGGFVLALSMQRWGLGKRIALMTLLVIGTSAPRMITGFMLVTAVLSAFVSNTATTAMMLPIAISTIALLKNQDRESSSSEPNEGKVNVFGTCLLLAIAYSASIGGVMTIIGTPTNAFLVGFLQKDISSEYTMEFSFVGWLPIGVSLVAVFLPLVYLMLTKVLFPIGGIQLTGGKKMIEKELVSLGSIQRGEWITFGVFSITVILWLVRPFITSFEFAWNGAAVRPLAGLTDTGIAMTAAMLLFVLPVDSKKREFTMNWATLEKMPWGILYLFGGGLSLASAVQANGVAEFMGSFTGKFGAMPAIVVVLAVTAGIIFLTELTSNVATTTSLVPVLAAVAPGLGIHPYLLIIPATVAASCAFMLPVATPPNAIVFGSGEITLSQMVRTGFWLNLIAIFIVTALAFLVVKPWLGL